MIQQSFQGRNGHRPNFSSPDEWLEHYNAAHVAGQRPWWPATRDELILADDVGLLELHPEWLPSSAGLRLLGLTDWFGRRQTGLSERFCERFLVSLHADCEFRSAVRNLLNHEVAE